MSVPPNHMQTPSPSYPGLEPESAGFGEYMGILRRRRKLLLMVGLPIIAVGATLALALPDMYRSEGQIEIEGAQAVRQNPNALAQDPEESPYADQYVRSLSTAVLSDRTLAKLLAEHKLYDDQADDPAGALEELRGDIKVDIVTVPILDPNTGRERDVVTAFTVAYDNKQPQRAQEGAEWLVNAFLAENRSDRQRQAGGRASSLRARQSVFVARLGAGGQAVRLQTKELRQAARAQRDEPQRHGSHRG